MTENSKREAQSAAVRFVALDGGNYTTLVCVTTNHLCKISRTVTLLFPKKSRHTGLLDIPPQRVTTVYVAVNFTITIRCYTTSFFLSNSLAKFCSRSNLVIAYRLNPAKSSQSTAKRCQFLRYRSQVVDKKKGGSTEFQEVDSVKLSRITRHVSRAWDHYSLGTAYISLCRCTGSHSTGSTALSTAIRRPA